MASRRGAKIHPVKVPGGQVPGGQVPVGQPRTSAMGDKCQTFLDAGRKLGEFVRPSTCPGVTCPPWHLSVWHLSVLALVLLAVVQG